jgi:thiosulfate/3-mercaptopyruvate sulfurtransferase
MRNTIFLCVLAAATFSGTTLTVAQVATDPEPLTAPAVVSTDWVAKHINDPGVIVLDTRSDLLRYTAGHLPGAVYLNIESLRATIDGVPAMLLPADDLARRFGAMGIARDSLVIIYGGENNAEPTYVAVALDRLGHRTYAIMEGGYAKWATEGRETTRALPSVTPAHYSPSNATGAFIADLSLVRAAVGDRGTTYIDARPPARFAEACVPGAIDHAATSDLIGGDAPVWKSKSELEAAYKAHGLTPESRVIVGCTTGRAASHAYFTLRHVLGYKNVKWYDGSMTEWLGHPDLPVERAKGESRGADVGKASKPKE